MTTGAADQDEGKGNEIHEHEWRVLPDGEITPGFGSWVAAATIDLALSIEACDGCHTIRNVQEGGDDGK